MQNSSSLTELLSRLRCVIRGRSGAVRSRHFVNRSSNGREAVAPDDVGTPLAELSQNQIISYVVVRKQRSNRTPVRRPVTGTRTSSGHAWVDSKIVCCRA